MPESEEKVTIDLEEELEPRLTKIEDGLFQFMWAPQYGLLHPGSSSFLMPTMGLAAFNPSSLPLAKELKEGDQVRVIVDFSNEQTKRMYDLWNPPEEYQVREQTIPMTVKMILDDSLEFPLIVCGNTSEVRKSLKYITTEIREPLSSLSEN